MLLLITGTIFLLIVVSLSLIIGTSKRNFKNKNTTKVNKNSPYREHFEKEEIKPIKPKKEKKPMNWKEFFTNAFSYTWKAILIIVIASVISIFMLYPAYKKMMSNNQIEYCTFYKINVCSEAKRSACNELIINDCDKCEKFVLEGHVHWGSNKFIGNFSSLEDVIKTANELNCKIEKGK